MKSIILGLLILVFPFVANAQTITMAAPSQEFLWQAEALESKTILMPPEQRNWQAVLDLYKKSADLGHPDAFTGMGNVYHYMADNENSRKYYELAASKGSSEGMYRLASSLYLENPNSCEPARKLLEKSANQGYPKAKTAAANFYLNGICGAANLKLGMAYLKEAANSGSAISQFNYADILNKSSKYLVDQRIAIIYYFLAANNISKSQQDAYDTNYAREKTIEIAKIIQKKEGLKKSYKELQKLCNQSGACQYLPARLYEQIRNGKFAQYNGFTQ